MPRKVEVRTETSGGWFKPLGDLSLDGAKAVFGAGCEARYVGGVLEYRDHDGAWRVVDYGDFPSRTVEEADKEWAPFKHRLRHYDDAPGPGDDDSRVDEFRSAWRAESIRANRLSDECGALKTELNEAYAKIGRQEREIEKLRRKR